MPNNNKPIEILLVEDNEGDVELTRIAFEECNLPHNMNVAHNGVEALDLLYKRGSFYNTPTPDIILLDLNMPKMDGKELLEVIKNTDQFKTIPVIVLTSSRAEMDVMESYRLYANCYIIKPLTLEKFIGVARRVEDFWVHLVKLPYATV